MTRATAKLTKRVVDQSQPSDKRFEVWDSELRGFGLRVEPSGTKSYLLRYRPKSFGSNAPKRFVNLGRHGAITPEQARQKALSILGEVALGADPAEATAKVMRSLSFAEAVELFLADHVRAKRKEGTASYYEWLFSSLITPELGKVKAAMVSRAQASKLHLKLRDTPYQANRVIAVISSLYTFLQKHGLVEDGVNPARGIERFKEEGRERYLSTEELSRLGAALREAETVGLPWDIKEENKQSKHLAAPEQRRTKLEPSCVLAIRLLLLTGARLREILKLKWKEVDLERGLVFLPDSKTGKKTIVLSSAAIALIQAAPRTGQYVIAGATPDRPRADLKKPWLAIQKRSGLTGVRLHDLRHTFASIGAGASLGLPIVGKLLGHTQPQTTARYAHLDANPLRTAVDLISDQLGRAMDS